MNRLLVVGAGASVEECKRSGKYPNDPMWSFPTMKNFCNKLFQPLPVSPITVTATEIRLSPQSYSRALLEATAVYLKARGISFDARFLNSKAGDSFSSEDLRKSPVGIFCQLEERIPETHNIESLCEYTWHIFGNDPAFWESFIYEGIYFGLFALFTQQFGIGATAMRAGLRVATQLTSGDMVLNLNYDILFDVALKQAQKTFCYAPNICSDTINVFKPHGSFNLYVNSEKGKFAFNNDVYLFNGNARLPDPEGGTISPYGGILPPRLNKSYEQHPIAEIILSVGHPYFPRVVTFWGVGLTASDVDLLSIYLEATNEAEIVEFINPSLEAYQHAETLLGKRISYFPTLDHWFEVYGIPDPFA